MIVVRSATHLIQKSCLSLLLVLLASASASAGEDAFWPQFHGPNRNNISTETGLLKRWPTDGPTLLWTARGIGQGCVFYSTGHKVGSRKLRLVVSDGEVSVKPLWDSRDLDNHHGGVVLLDDYLYGSGHRRGWICLDWETGKTMYNEPGVGKGSLTCAEGMLYTLGERARMGLVEATPQRHEVIGEFRLPPGGEGPSWAHPVVCGDRLYIRHDDFLFAYDIKASE